MDMAKLNCIIIFCFLFITQGFAQKTDSVKICGFNFAIVDSFIFDSKKELSLDCNIKVIQDFDIDGKVLKESFWLEEVTPIYETRFFKMDGTPYKTIKRNDSEFDICYALNIANKYGLINKQGFYISITDTTRFDEYENHWLVGYEKVDGEDWTETIGKVIDLQNGLVENYHSLIHDQPLEDGIEMENLIKEAPEFTGGQDSLKYYIQSSIKVPVDSLISGRVYITFKIDTSGQVKNCKILRGINEYLNNESLRIVKNMPKWTPGKIGKKNIETNYVVPVIFRSKMEE